jgi:hypothetical protein
MQFLPGLLGHFRTYGRTQRQRAFLSYAGFLWFWLLKHFNIPAFQQRTPDASSPRFMAAIIFSKMDLELAIGRSR